MKNQLIVISSLDGKGPTGVETHFNQLIEEAQARGIDGVLVSAYPSQRLWAKLARLLIRFVRLVDKERAEVLSLRLNSLIIAAKLDAVLAPDGGCNGTATLYAQDPVSACVALKANRHRRCRVVTVIHYNVSMADELRMKGQAKTDGPLWRFIVSAEKESLPLVDHIIFVSAFMQREIGARMAAVASVPQSVISNFIGRSSLSGERLAAVGDLIAIGTLEARKNQAFLLHVLARAKARGFLYTLAIVGDGPDRAKLEALSAQLGLQEQVTFAGLQKNAARLIPQYRLLVHAALMESQGICLIEALATGRPILAPAVGGIPEVFSHGVEGYFWPLDDVDAATGLLIEALTDTDTYRRLSQAALARYQEKFHIDLLAGQWLATILNQRQGTAQVTIAEATP